MNILKSIISIFIILSFSSAQSFDLQGVIQRGRTAFQNGATIATNYIHDTFVFDSVPIEQHRVNTINALNQVRNQNLEIINNPNTFPAHRDFVVQTESQRSNTCAPALQLEDELKTKIDVNCKPLFVRQECTRTSNTINGLVSDLGLTPEEVTRSTHNAQRAGILDELRGFRKRIYLTLKDEIRPLNDECTNLMTTHFNGDACLQTYNEVVPRYTHDISQLCTEEAVNGMFERFISHMKSQESPFYGVWMVQTQRQAARQTEFEIATLLIQVDDAVKAWEEAGRAPLAPLISPRPQASPRGTPK